MKTRILSVAAACVASVVLSTSAVAFNPGGDVTSDFAQNGGRAVTTQALGGGCTVFRPTQLTGNHPVILWGNGTGASPTTYAAGLRHLASYGFVVVAANTSNAGTGTDMIGCLNSVSNSSLRSQLNLSRVGTSGHSQGGGGSIMAGRDDRITATAPVQPFVLGLGHNPISQVQQNGPMLLLSGSSDTLATPTANQQTVFNRTNVPVFWAIRQGASHFEPVGDFGDFRGAITAWFLFTLTGDPEAADLFTGPCTFCQESGWTNRRRGLQ